MPTVNNNTPTLRFPEFKEKWELKKLGKIAKVSSGGTPSRAQSNYWNGNIPWVSTTLIDFNTILESNEFITNDGLANSSAKLFPKGTLLMAMYGQGKTRGKVAILGIEATTNQACGAIVPNNDKLNELFLFQNLAGRYDEIRDLSNQGGQENLSGEIIKNILITFPTLPEQQKIATFLTTLDEKLQALKQKKNLLEQYKKGVMQQIFSQELRFKDDNGNDFANWEEKKFGDVFSFRITNSLSREKLNYESGKVKNIHYGDIHTKFNLLFDINKEPVPYINIDVELKKINPDNYCKIGDLIIADASEDYTDIGKSIEIINLNNEKILAGLHTFLARPHLNMTALGYSGYLMKSKNVRLQIMTIAQGSKILSISTTRLSNITIGIPCLEEQTKIANFLSAIDVKINQCQAQITNTEVWKKGLLQQMFV